jgi:hypothetical protein
MACLLSAGRAQRADHDGEDCYTAGAARWETGARAGAAEEDRQEIQDRQLMLYLAGPLADRLSY